MRQIDAFGRVDLALPRWHIVCTVVLSMKTILRFILVLVLLTGCLARVDSPESPFQLMDHFLESNAGGKEPSDAEGQVEPPVISPSSQVIASGDLVVISTTAPSTLYYTVDGSEPTLASSSGASPTAVMLSGSNGTHIFVKAFARYPDDSVSPVTTEDYVIAAVAPSAPSFSPTNQAVSSGTVVTMSTLAGATIYYTVDGSDPSLASSSGASPVSVTLTGSNGTHILIKAFAVYPVLGASGIATEDYVIAH
ncbi:MAG: hypothetical protein F9K24_08305 [Leptonema illini]|uniref:Uncharacterized protein n=1 Tax=Leptonema illini TaxID=183 RepID=A0A833LXV7_9LEPT|nr:MAG: hypothetical protein F9K24_08305 [Leptonema illini]